MTSWSDGYMTEVGYTYGYYHELNPLRVRPALNNQRLMVDSIKTVCELGYGQGLSANLIAAGQANLEYWGTDFNPSHARFAQYLASKSGANIHLFDQSFEEFCGRSDLPDFDFISLHGIWSWISDHNREIIVNFIKNKLKLGGVVYISYNSLPGWAHLTPLRHLLTIAEQTGNQSHSSVVDRINHALQTVQQFADTRPVFFQHNSLVQEKFQQLKSANRQYIAHEFFNSDWRPFYFSETHAALTQSKLTFACSAACLQHINIFNFTNEQIALLDQTNSIPYKETLRDYFTNTQFRKDYWIKGAMKTTDAELHSQFKQLRFVLIANKNNLAGKLKTAIGEFTLDEKIYRPILEFIVKNDIVSVEEIAQTTGLTIPILLEAITVLQGMDVICVAQSESDIERSKPQCDRINEYLIDQENFQHDINFLASPVLGGGIVVPIISRQLIAAFKRGISDERALIDCIKVSLNANSQRLTNASGSVMTEEEQQLELEKLTQQFLSHDLARYQRLRII